jgi:hypothetical protein
MVHKRRLNYNHYKLYKILRKNYHRATQKLQNYRNTTSKFTAALMPLQNYTNLKIITIIV